MANTVKGITIKYSADASELTKSLKEASASANKAQKSLKDINKVLKFNPGNVTLLKQKQDELRKVVDATAKELEGFKKELESMDAQGVDKASEEYQKLERKIIETDSKLNKFTKDLIAVTAASSKLGVIGSKMQSAGTAIENVGNKLRAASVAATAFVTAVGAATYKTGVWADDLNTLSKVAGVSTDKLQLYASAAELVDVDVSTIARSVSKMKKSMLSASQGSKNIVDAFESLGVSVKDSNGELRDQDEVFGELLEKLGSMENETKRDATAMQIFGKSAANLNPLIEDCGETYKSVLKTFNDNDIQILDQKTLDQANELNDYVDTVKMTTSQAVRQVTASLAPKLNGTLAKISTNINKLAGKLANLDDDTIKMIGTAAGVVAAASPVLIVGGKLVKLAGTISKSWSVLLAGGASMTSVFGGLSLAIGAGTAAAIAFEKSNIKARQAACQLTNAEKDTIDALNNSVDAYSSAKSAADEQSESISAEFTNASKLVGQYNQLVNSKGKISKKDQEHADFIMSTLAQALGVEESEIQSMIGANGKLEGSIRKVIAAKEAQAYLDANYDSYVEALKLQTENTESLAGAIVAMNNAKKEAAKTQAALESAQEKYNNYVESGGRYTAQYKQAVYNAKNANDAAQKSYETASKSVEGYADAAGDAASRVDKYEALKSAAVSGNQKKIEKAIANYKSDLKTQTNATKTELKKQYETANTQYQAIKSAYESGQAGVTKAMVKQMRDRRNQAAVEAGIEQSQSESHGKSVGSKYASGVGSKAGDAKSAGQSLKSGATGGLDGGYDAAYSKGEDFATGYYDGITGIAQNVADKAAQKIVEAAKNAVAKAQKSSSPSKVAMELGNYFGDGYAIGIADKAKEALRASESLVYGAQNGAKVKKGFNLVANKCNPASSVASELGSIISGANATIVLQIDGKTVATTTAPYMESALNSRKVRANRRLGYVGA